MIELLTDIIQHLLKGNKRTIIMFWQLQMLTLPPVITFAQGCLIFDFECDYSSVLLFHCFITLLKIRPSRGSTLPSTGTSLLRVLPFLYTQFFVHIHNMLVIPVHVAGVPCLLFETCGWQSYFHSGPSCSKPD